MHRNSLFLATVVACFGLAISVLAQQPGQPGGRGRGGPPGGGGFFFGGGGASRMGLLNVEEVQKELELTDEQIDEIRKVAAEIREKYGFGFGGRGVPGGERGRGGPQGGEGQKGRRGPGSGNNDRALQAAPAQWYFVQAQQPEGQGRRGGGPGGQGLTPEQRAEMERQRAERTREENAKLAEILLPHQLKRLTEIYIQRAGVAALQDEGISKDLGINDEQKNRITKIREEFSTKRRELFSAGGRGGGGGGGGADFEATRAKMVELTGAEEQQIFGVLTAQQKTKFEEMKGKSFAMPERGPGGPGGPGGTRGRRGNNN
jgi:Spy/CpxP family protein refolding chaperone